MTDHFLRRGLVIRRNAAADFVMSMDEVRSTVAADQRQLKNDRVALIQVGDEVEAQKSKLSAMLDQLRTGLASVLDFIKRPDTPVHEQMEAARLAKRVTPPRWPSYRLIGSGPAKKSPKASDGGKTVRASRAFSSMAASRSRSA